jgi:hypothetical protein
MYLRVLCPLIGFVYGPRMQAAIAFALAVSVTAQEPADDGAQPSLEAAPSEDASAEEGASAGEQQDFSSFLNGNFLDPQGEFWRPRRGARMELGLFLGGEAGLAGVTPSTDVRIPSFGGVALSPVMRFYPVDQVALVVGGKNYFGIEQPAAGTGATTVFTPFFGVRYDLVNEARFSLLTDVMSGPTFFVFADPTDPEDRENPFAVQWALGAEVSGGLTGRYTLGPITFELRGVVGGRAGSAQDIGRPEGDVGPFSALFAGLDLGVTWSFFSDGSAPTNAEGGPTS